ncbi:uncharacterized protein LOC18440824 [Amborella trichopoda]|uniref:DUF547 domain-containing protein n=1 Tax=Amborella trichopoda TaxID=13333 RepID=W1PXJ9_AMBTC|nr:uncharacterized protein LOC18440824 [Amborella trichopoda]XP_020527031.1 uncharacterized protein LOC18440824 [Amborella trichopoda]XP_020527032.1 uncharacterized protein LOC18440824 [Amborella trichopoda]XP_020527033.1 uncharacterized protein LOC18440824 [Amborella trichopoda]XP_020527034.1 uncharacterized protein LOC18440824 [Amborella trichopoda]ERN12606.1 hypothetical protein AMTR_s00025p00226120 [Amborella trichopoda]|eukprot:XP_006851025.1 uncharacterized protein LOC18440824 [Amborella trichopoda]
MLCLSAESHDYGIHNSSGVGFDLIFSPLHSCSQDVKSSHLAESRSFIEGYSENDRSSEFEGFGSNGEVGTHEGSNDTCLYRLQLEQDVQRLQKQLQEEMELHGALESAVGRDSLVLSSLSCLPSDAQDLLSEIATLEATVLKLEKEMLSLNFQLSQERNERRLMEYRLKQSPSQSQLLCSLNKLDSMKKSRFGGLKHSVPQRHLPAEAVLCDEVGGSQSNTSSEASSSSPEEVKLGRLNMPMVENNTAAAEPDRQEIYIIAEKMSLEDLWHHPNKLSEEMVRCMRNIFISLADSSSLSSKSCCSNRSDSLISPKEHIFPSSSPSGLLMGTPPVQSPMLELQYGSEVLATEIFFDPYRVRGKLSWRNIGRYSSAIEVSWMSVGKKQLEHAAEALRNFRVLVEQLGKVNPTHLSCDEKLAFWINLYNALIMHAYLAYGVPRNEIKLFSLMQKAAYTVGGHSFSAAFIEYVILNMKPPVHRPQLALLLALHKFKISEEQKVYCVDNPDPQVAFALSCGMYSSPAVRIFTAENVKEELQYSLRDYVRASIGVTSKGKLILPKMLHCFARTHVDEVALHGWIAQFLEPQQAAALRECSLQRSKRIVGARSCGLVPFDFRFRYLFLPALMIS